ncbi:PREDICTED: LOC18792841 isoform, partial [Prunus dulcis]
SRTEVEELNQQQPPGDGNHFPSLPRMLFEQEPQGETTQQELPQVNMDRHDQGGGSSSRFHIRNNNITADPSNFHNVRGQGGGQGGHDICGNTITARGASNVGYHNFGNTTPDRICCIL